jgi:hypothetical protein
MWACVEEKEGENKKPNRLHHDTVLVPLTFPLPLFYFHPFFLPWFTHSLYTTQLMHGINVIILSIIII